MDSKIDVYDDFATEYAEMFATRERLVDIPTPEKVLNYLDDKLIPKGYQFPYFMILSFTK